MSSGILGREVRARGATIHGSFPSTSATSARRMPLSTGQVVPPLVPALGHSTLASISPARRIVVVAAGTSGDNGQDSDNKQPAQQPPSSASAVTLPDTRVVLLVLLLLAATAAAVTGSGNVLVEAVEEAVAGDVSVAGAALFVGAYALATVLLFPASVLTLAAGALFGPLQGTVLVSLASTLGAALAFLTSRYLARPFVEAKLPEYPKLQAMVKGISSQGMKAVALLRLSPLFPFNLLNYALGLTNIGFGQYVLASWAGMLPGTFAYVFLGGVGRVAADSAVSGFQPVKVFLYVVGAVATLGVTKIVADVASQALAEEEGNEV